MTPAQRPRPARSTRGTMTAPALWRDLRREFEQLATRHALARRRLHNSVMASPSTANTAEGSAFIL
jgi:hypothetical protein